MDAHIVGKGQNQNAPFHVTAENTPGWRKPLHVALVNISGDVYNSGGGSSSGGDGAILDGVNSAIKATVKSDATAIPDSADSALVVSMANGISREVGKVTVRGITSGIGITGDVTAVGTKFNNGGADDGKNIGVLPAQVGATVQSYSDGRQTSLRVKPDGDLVVTLEGESLSVGITGDVSTTPKTGQTWPASIQNRAGVHVSGGLTGVTGDVSTVPKAGETWPVSLSGTLNVSVQNRIGAHVSGGLTGVTGDVSTVPKAGETWPVSLATTVNVREQAVIGTQVVGGQAGITGDVAIKPTQTSNVGRFPVSGDMAISDGASPSVKATVRDYSTSNPVAVSLTNSSGDTIDHPTAPLIITAAGRVANQGSNSIVTAVSGKRIKVTSYSLQGDGDNARGYFASGASGSQLTTEWEFATREGVVKQNGGGRSRSYIFATGAGAALSLECSSSKGIKYDVSYFVEDAT